MTPDFGPLSSPFEPDPVPGRPYPDPNCTCERCGHKWTVRRYDDTGRAIYPKACPSCDSPYWQTPRMKKRDRVKVQRKAATDWWAAHRKKGGST